MYQKLRISLSEKTSALGSAMIELEEQKTEVQQFRNQLEKSIERSKLADVLELEVTSLRNKLQENDDQFAKDRESQVKWRDEIKRMNTHINDLLQGREESDRKVESISNELVNVSILLFLLVFNKLYTAKFCF